MSTLGKRHVSSRKRPSLSILSPVKEPSASAGKRRLRLDPETHKKASVNTAALNLPVNGPAKAEPSSASPVKDTDIPPAPPIAEMAFSPVSGLPVMTQNPMLSPASLLSFVNGGWNASALAALHPYFAQAVLSNAASLQEQAQLAMKSTYAAATPTKATKKKQVTSPSSNTSSNSGAGTAPSKRRNYKNLTRERRQEANARERTRVHTIGATFEELRRLVPSYSPEQKLSKLSILRIASKYIQLLAAMLDRDYSPDQSEYSVRQCVELLTAAIAQESKVNHRLSFV